MSRFDINVLRSRDEEGSVARYQLQTDGGPVVTAVFSTASRSRGEEYIQRRYELQTDNALFRSRGDEGGGSELSPLTDAGPACERSPSEAI
jgi:hypothetical protein